MKRAKSKMEYSIISQRFFKFGIIFLIACVLFTWLFVYVFQKNAPALRDSLIGVLV